MCWLKTNTCPIDGIISILSIQYNHNGLFESFVDDNSDDRHMAMLKTILKMYRNREWDEARVMTGADKFCKYDFETSDGCPRP